MLLARRAFAAILLCLGLSGCFTAPTSLIGPGDAVFPFERIVFAEVSQLDSRQILTRRGDAYGYRLDSSDEREAALRIKQVGESLYVAQMEVTEGEKTQRLYAVLRADLAGGRVWSYAAIKPDAFATSPGLSICDDMVCIDDLDAYVAYAKGLIDAGAPPDAEYKIIETE